MHQQQPQQEPELRNTIIRCAGRLKSLHPRYPNADVRPLDHRYVIGTVTDGKRHSFRVFRDALDDFGLLQGRYAATDDNLAGHAEPEEVSAQFATEGVLQSLAVNNEGNFVLFLEVVAEVSIVAEDRLSCALKNGGLGCWYLVGLRAYV